MTLLKNPSRFARPLMSSRGSVSHDLNNWQKCCVKFIQYMKTEIMHFCISVAGSSASTPISTDSSTLGNTPTKFSNIKHIYGYLFPNNEVGFLQIQVKPPMDFNN